MLYPRSQSLNYGNHVVNGRHILYGQYHHGRHMPDSNHQQQAAAMGKADLLIVGNDSNIVNTLV